jgi:allantoinase
MIIRSTRVVLPDGVAPASITIENGTIVRIDRDEPEFADARLKPSHSDNAGARGLSRAFGELVPSDQRLDVGDLVISPGIVDTHVHINEPGRTDWEGFDTATRAAAAGGVTTVVDMPLNSIPATTTVAALEAKRAAARERCHVDVAFWGGVVPGNAAELEPLVAAGVRGFKCFLAPSGVDEFPHVGEVDLRAAMPIIARLGVPLLVHAEDPRSLRTIVDASRIADYRAYLETRPPASEVDAIRLMVRLSREYGAHVHIVHVASREAADELARAKSEGVRITAETCPHYLTFAAEEIPDGATEFKCAPPIREAAQREALRDALRSGTLDLVATDHSPAPPTLKCPGDFARAWGGIASLELSLAATWTTLNAQLSTLSRRAESSAFDVESSALNVESSAALCALAAWLSERPAALAGLSARKGRIAVGSDADLMIWDPDAEMTVDPMTLQQRHQLTPYAGRRLRGVVTTAMVRGERVWEAGQVRSGRGRLL